uniref:CSON007906 protein n=1 Tax=Culicoides sonorensis TaxID=179676 RepID=A0A336MZ17_CULSO
MKLKWILKFFVILSFERYVTCLWENCDYFQQLELGVTYTISSPNYPNFYGTKPFSCRWTAKAPLGYIVAYNCYVEVPQGLNCDRDRLLLSRTGVLDVSRAEVYCGKQWFTADSFDESGVIGLLVPFTTTGGRFQCNLSAVKKDCACGYKNGALKTPYIVGGTETRINEYPMFAALVDLNVGQVYCGGTIISPSYIVTAAHCLTKRIPDQVGILVGDHDYTIGSDTQYSALYRSSSFIVHEKYSSLTKQHDIALIKTAEMIQFNYGVSPVCLPFRYQWSDITGQYAEFVGYGTKEFGGPVSKVPLKATVKVISNTECSQKMSNIINDQVCGYTSGKDACQNDSGGPMFYTDSKGIVYNIGVISYGNGCGGSYPSVNTRITSYLKWILSKTENNYCYM